MATQPNYGPPSYPPPPQQSSSNTIIWIVVLVLVLVIGLPILLVAVVFLGCCGMFGLGMYSMSQIPAEMVKQQYSDHPVIQQHIGEIQSATLNFADTSAEQQKQPDGPGATVLVIDVRGTKGSGQIIGHQEPGNPPGQFFSKATLRTKQGEFQLSP
ncbi:MAG TPA: hypothetical protein VFB96_17090 [Pirellulaceae bacterium]|nr:hypothetical protein [Pirellulaceae bacterium]